MALDPSSIAGSIAGLTVTGVTILTPATLKPAIQARDCPVIYPAFEFVTGLTDEVRSLGLAGNALHQYRYNLNYYLAYQPAGSGRYPTESTAAIIAAVKEFGDALRGIDTTSGSSGALALYVTLGDVRAPAVVPDPADNQHWGASITVSVWERQQA